MSQFKKDNDFNEDGLSSKANTVSGNNNSHSSSFSSSNDRYLLNFSISHKDPNSTYFKNDSMSSNIISETSLEEDCILLKKKSLLKRKFISSEKIYYREIVDLDLVKSSVSSLYSSIRIVYSKNGYSKRFLSLSSSDSFAVRWFYDALVVKYSYVHSDLGRLEIFGSNEKKWVAENGAGDENMGFKDNLDNSVSPDDSNNSFSSGDFKQSKLSDFMSVVSEELSEEESRKLKKKLRFDRCSSGEY